MYKYNFVIVSQNTRVCTNLFMADVFSSIGIINLAEFIIGTIAIVLLPGPNSLYVLATAAKRGIVQGFWAAFGVFIGDTILMFAAATGVTALLKAFPVAYLTLRWIGAIYLAWIGFNLIRAGWLRWSKRHAHRSSSLANASSLQERSMHPTKAALGLSLTNPKAIFFFISFFTQFVDENALTPGLAFFVLGVILQIISLIYLSTLIYAGAGLSKSFHQRPGVAASGMVFVGIIFLFFGVRLVFF